MAGYQVGSGNYMSGPDYGDFAEEPDNSTDSKPGVMDYIFPRENDGTPARPTTPLFMRPRFYMGPRRSQ